MIKSWRWRAKLPLLLLLLLHNIVLLDRGRLHNRWLMKVKTRQTRRGVCSLAMASYDKDPFYLR